jgi:hypothetical protein
LPSTHCRICRAKLESDESGACQDCQGVLRIAHAIHLTLPKSHDYPGHADRLRAHTVRIRAELARMLPADAG